MKTKDLGNPRTQDILVRQKDQRTFHWIFVVISDKSQRRSQKTDKCIAFSSKNLIDELAHIWWSYDFYGWDFQHGDKISVEMKVSLPL